MNNKFKKVGMLLALSLSLGLTTLNNANASTETYKLTTSTNVYINAADAQAGRNARGTYAQGTYYVYKKYNGMINISRVQGKPGGWIKPVAQLSATPKPATTTSTVAPVTTTKTATTAPVSNNTTYVLKQSTRGYVNAADAQAGRNPRTTLTAGTYTIYKTYNGMLNLTKKAGVPGSWVNPNSATTTTSAPKPVTTTSAPKPVTTTSPKLYTLRQFQYHGVIRWGGKKFTYYSQSVLPGYGLKIPGRHVNANGYVADKDGYIVLASNSRVAMGTVIDTPFGSKGKVYDRCPSCSIEWFDVYTK